MAGSRQGETMKRIVSTKKAAAMYNPVSQATLAQNGMLYTAGMVGRSPDTGDMLPSFDEQAHQALRNLGALLQEAGGGYRDVMFVQLYLLDMEKIERFNEIFRGYFPEEPPARAVCQPLRLYPGAEVMFTAVACISSGPAS
jgi:2-iminobutanoate/2-iminopropanoate deaminase